jgi:hypothetical protein
MQKPTVVRATPHPDLVEISCRGRTRARSDEEEKTRDVASCVSRVDMTRELSGFAWVDRFPTSKSTEMLAESFRRKCEAFLKALADAGATVDISATLRPPERAYLMHWSYAISACEVEPEDVPPQAGVEIEWVHQNSNGSPDLAASRAAAAAMVQGYDIVDAHHRSKVCISSGRQSTCLLPGMAC